MQSIIVPLLAYNISKQSVKYSGLSFIDTTLIKVCNNKRISRNKVFDGIAVIGKTTVGWFYGFKLHLTINEQGEILSFYLTSGNVADFDRKTINKLTNELFGKLFADKGYIFKNLFEMLYGKGIHIITDIYNNMKNKIMDMTDKLLLRKRSIIETVNDFLKNIC